MTFSVITPSFNQLDWLRLCVASVRDQVDVTSNGMRNAEFEMGSAESEIQNPKSSIPPVAVEHIIQDAGSPGIEDFAREVGADFYRDDKLISHSPFRIPNYSLTIYCERDEGMYDAINRGLARTSGEICAWLNSDEQYLVGTLAKVAEIFQDRPDLEVLLGDALITDADHNPVCYRRIMVPGRWHTRLDHLHSLSCAMFFKRSVLPAPPMDPKWKVIGDAVLMDYFLGSRKKIHACRELLSTYAFTGKNLSADKSNNEHERWIGECGWPPAGFRPFVVAVNRIRRLMHGAYRSFEIVLLLHTHAAGVHRRPIQGAVSGRLAKLEPDIHRV